MARLVAFGCSWTYGQGLPDCYQPNLGGPGLAPSKFAWPELVSKNLRLPVSNQGSPGASNTFILSKILEYTFDNDDLIVILWSFHDRSTLFTDEKTKINILPKCNDKFLNELSDGYYRLHSDYDLFIQTIRSISHANLFLEKKQLTVYNFYFDPILQRLINQYPNSIPSSMNLTFLQREKIKIDKAMDNTHLGIKSQVLISNYILHTMKKNEN